MLLIFNLEEQESNLKGINLISNTNYYETFNMEEQDAINEYKYLIINFLTIF